ncbi:hypothetical protein NQZ68_032303 [Dissostichus eleginoides]|nr:hypothetical protein NQZ68_032303 [Dissostichus eleginoides]
MAGEFHTVTEVVKAGRVTAPERGALLKDCSLKINHLVLDDARLYSCDNGVLNSNVSLEILKDGIEEVFTAVGESVSLSCRNTSSLSVGGSVKWAVGERTLTDDISPYGGQTEALHLNKDSSLVITKVGALNAGDYQCSESTDEQKVFKIRLHTLDVTSERVPGGDNLTLTCVLTCSKECGKDFDLLWSGGSHNSWQSGLIHVNNTLLNKLFLPVLSVTGELTCSIQREGEVMASKKWRSIDPLQTPAWVAVPLALLMCISAIGLYMYMKRKHNKNTENEQPSIGM